MMKRCAEHVTFKKTDAAFREGDLAALLAAVDDATSVPNGPMPLTMGAVSRYAIYTALWRSSANLLEAGTDPNPADHAGFPPLLAALGGRSVPGSPGRPDVLEIMGTAARVRFRSGSTWDQATTHRCTWL